MPVNKENLIQTLQRMKIEYETAIRNGTYTNLIRSKRLIDVLHEFVINELSSLVNEEWIIKDKKVYGFPKKKEQDILVQPPQVVENMDQFVRKGLVSEKFANMYCFEELSITNFFDELYKVIMERFYLLIKE